ncbi:MAG: hypothetical protein GY757_23500 [bacterium]|nr:hypothetical protein [bacterium]
MPEKLIGVGDGQRIEISPGKYFEVIETPGHTKCSISYLLQPGGILFQGDSAGIIEKDRSIKPLFLSGYGDSKTSIKKLLALEAEALAFPHNRCIRGKTRVETHLKSALARMEELKDKIIRLLEGGKNVIGIAELIHDEDFPNPTLLGPREARTINFEALVKVVSKEFNIEPRK